MDENRQHETWAKTYWVIVVNQVLVVGVFTFLAMAMLRESYRASEAAELALPGFTEWYFSSIGPTGLAVAGLVSVAISLTAIGLRRRFAAIMVTSLSFVVCVVFLACGILSSILPLLMAIRDMLPPEAL